MKSIKLSNSENEDEPSICFYFTFNGKNNDELQIINKKVIYRLSTILPSGIKHKHLYIHRANMNFIALSIMLLCHCLLSRRKLELNMAGSYHKKHGRQIL